MSQSRLGFLSIILACLCWASDSYFRYPLINQGMSSTLLVFLEHSILMVLFVLPLFTGLKVGFKKFDRSVWISFIVVGMLGSALATVFFSQAMQYLNPSVVILMQKLQPVFALYFARVFLKEQLSSSFLFLAFAALLGAIMLSYPDLEKVMTMQSILVSNDFKNTVTGYGYTLLSVIIWAAASIFGKNIFNKTANSITTEQVMAIRYFLGWLTLGCFFVFTNNSIFPNDLDAKKWGAIIAMVIVSAVIGMRFYYQGVKLLRPRNIVVAELWYPFMAIIVNKFILGINLNLWQLIGASILVFATFRIQSKKIG